MRENIVITGSRGFIGTHLRNFLKDEKIEEVSRSLGRDTGDLTGRTGILIDLAAYKREDESFHNPALYIENNVQRLASVLTRNRFSGVIFASSYSVYDQEGNLEPSSVYGITKLMGEKLVRLYYKNSWILRIAQPYGEWDTFSVFYVMARCKNNKEVFRLFDSPNLCRDYFDVELIPKVVKNIIDGKVVPGIYNLGSGKSVPVTRFLRYICNKYEINYQLVTPPQGATIRYMPNKNTIFGKQGDLEEVWLKKYLS